MERMSISVFKGKIEKKKESHGNLEGFHPQFLLTTTATPLPPLKTTSPFCLTFSNVFLVVCPVALH